MRKRMASIALALAVLGAWDGWATRILAQDAEQNRAMFAVLINQVFNAGNVALVDYLVSRDVSADGAPLGRDGFKTLVKDRRARTPDYHIAIQEVVTEGDRVTGRVTEQGGGGAVSRLVIIRVAGGEVSEYWTFADEPALRRQFGLAGTPAPEPSN